MPYCPSFTREEVISGLIAGNPHKFVDGGRSPQCNRNRINRKNYLGFRKSVENVLNALDAVCEKLGDNNSVWFDTLMWYGFSCRRRFSTTSFDTFDGQIFRIGKEHTPTWRSSSTERKYLVEFENATVRSVCYDPRFSGNNRLWFCKEYHGDRGLSRLAFTLNDLLYCTDFESFDISTEQFVKDGFGIPEDVENLKLLMELVREAKELDIVLPVDLNTLLREGNRTKYDILSQRGRLKDIPKSVNRYPLVIGYMMKYSLPYFGKEGLPKFQGDNAKKCIRILRDNSIIFRCRSGLRLRECIDMAIAKSIWPDIDYRVAVQYMHLCKKNGRKADLSIRNEHTMLDLIVEMSPKDRNHDRKMKIAEPFRILAGKIKGYGLLLTEGEMKDEGLRQHNCVRTYIRDVNAGRCGIFTHVNGKGERFTIEVGYSDGQYRCLQFKGTCNSSSPEDEAEFIAVLNAVNAEISNGRTLRLHGADLAIAEPRNADETFPFIIGADDGQKMAVGAETKWEEVINRQFNKWLVTTMQNFTPQFEGDVPF